MASNAEPVSTFAETDLWMSPEMLSSGSNSPKSLSYAFSLGLIALYCLDTDEFRKKQKKLNTDKEELENYLNEFYNKCANKRFFYLLGCMLSYSPSARPSID